MADKRFLRTALLTSERWNALTDDAQNFYVRLLMIVDDFGCFDGRVMVIQQQAYYLGRVTPPPLDALHQAGLLVRYTNAGKTYIALTNWGEHLRGRRTFPAPPVNVDIGDIAYRGKFGKDIGWHNPAGADEVSILIDANSRPVAPQPREWRDPARGWAPIGAHTTFVKPMPKMRVHKPEVPEVVHKVVQGHVDADGVVHGVVPRAEVVPEVATPSLYAVPSPLPSPSPSPSPLPSPTQAGSTSGTQALSTNPAATTTANGGIHLNPNGAGWSGVSEAQRLHWQSMFDGLSIPDQLERAAEWLRAHPEERDQYDQQPEGNYAYIVRWLLRESRAAAH